VSIPHQAHLFTETKSFNHVPRAQFELSPVTEQYVGAFTAPSTISHMSSLQYHFLKPLVKEKSLKGAFYKNQWTSKLRLNTTIRFVLLSCYQLLPIKSVNCLDKMSLIYILIWINSKIALYSIEDIKREMKNINKY